MKRILAARLLALAILGCASPDAIAERAAYDSAVADQAAFRAGLAESCAELPQLDATIQAAISIGAPIYNAGSPLGCYRIYEGAAYKLLYALDGRCPRAVSVLRAGLAKAESEDGVDVKAWTMRRTFDVLLCEATRYGKEPTL